jgi:hypothetical protein
MPRNVTTGKVNRHVLSAKEVFEYRLEQRKDPKLHSVGPQKGKKPEKSQSDNPKAEVSGSGLSPSASLAKMTLDSTSSKSNSPVPEQAPGTSSAFLPVASTTPQISPPSYQGHQKPPPTAPTTLSQLSSQLNNDARTLAARLVGLEEHFEELKKEISGMNGRLGGFAKEVAGMNGRLGGFAKEVAGIDGRLAGLVKGVMAWRKDFELKFIGSQ